ncbi:hypothetical protein KCU83_g6184, partial [Aureobasidium melanogenum]
MEAVSIMDGSSFEQILGQGTIDPSLTPTDSSNESVLKAMSESSQGLESPFQSAIDTPQSSVVNIVFRPPPPPPQPQQHRRVARFVECACVSGGACVGTGGQAMCDCSLAPPNEVKTPRRGEKKRAIKKVVQGIAKALRRAWNRPVQALGDATARAVRKQKGY